MFVCTHVTVGTQVLVHVHMLTCVCVSIYIFLLSPLVELSDPMLVRSGL